MKMVTYLLLAGLILTPKFAAADDVKEATTKTGNELKQGTKKAKHRIKEATCTDSDLECKAKKAGHRVDEGASNAGNKLEEKKAKKD